MEVGEAAPKAGATGETPNPVGAGAMPKIFEALREQAAHSHHPLRVE